MAFVTGLYYERYRNYSPSLGRWISQDPIGYQGGINLYEYVDDRPAQIADPQGTHAEYSINQPGLYRPQGNFTVTMSIPDVNSVAVQVNYNVPIMMVNKPCGCKEIAIVQYVKDAWNGSKGAISLKGVQYQLDGTWPYGKGDKKMSQPWLYPTGNIAALYDNPSAAGFGNGAPWIHVGNFFIDQRLFQARDVAVCMSGKEKGDYYGAVTWGFYESWLDSTLATLQAGKKSAGGPIIPGSGHWPKGVLTPYLYVNGVAPEP